MLQFVGGSVRGKDLKKRKYTKLSHSCQPNQSKDIVVSSNQAEGVLVTWFFPRFLLVTCFAALATGSTSTLRVLIGSRHFHETNEPECYNSLDVCFYEDQAEKDNFHFQKKRSSKHYLLTEVSIFSSQQLYFPLKAQNQLFFGILKKTNTKKNSISIKLLLQIFSLSLQCEQGNKEIVLIYV